MVVLEIGRKHWNRPSSSLGFIYLIQTFGLIFFLKPSESQISSLSWPQKFYQVAFPSLYSIVLTVSHYAHCNLFNCQSLNLLVQVIVSCFSLGKGTVLSKS